MYVYILFLVSIIILSQNLIFTDAYSQDLDLKCNPVIDKNEDGVPDRIEAKSSINWSHCNLEGQDISRIQSFDYTESNRPFDKNGIPAGYCSYRAPRCRSAVLSVGTAPRWDREGGGDRFSVHCKAFALGCLLSEGRPWH